MVRKQRRVDSAYRHRNEWEECFVIPDCSMNSLPGIREEARDVNLVRSPLRTDLASNKLDRVFTVFVHRSYLEQTERRISTVKVRLHEEYVQASLQALLGAWA